MPFLAGLEIPIVVGLIAWAMGGKKGDADADDDEDDDEDEDEDEDDDDRYEGEEEEESKETIFEEPFEVKKPTGKPPWGPETFVHTDPLSVRLQFTLLGYANNQFDMTMPSGAFVKQFQRDYNSVSAACLNEAMPYRCNRTKWGRTTPGGKVKEKTLLALETAKRRQFDNGDTWQGKVQKANAAGF